MKRRIMAAALAIAMMVQPIGTGSWNVVSVQAAETTENVLNVGKNSIAGTGEKSTTAYTFVPEETGLYTMEFAEDVSDARINNYSPSIEKLDWENSNGAYLLKAGITYTFRINNSNETAVDFTITKVQDVRESEEGTIILIKEPKALTVKASENLSVNVLAAGEELKYQWQISEDGTTWTDIKYAIYDSYELTVDAAMNGMKLRCVIASSSETMESAAVDISVTPIVEPYILAKGTYSLEEYTSYLFRPEKTAYYTFDLNDKAEINAVFCSSHEEIKVDSGRYLLKEGTDYYVEFRNVDSESVTVDIRSDDVSISQGGKIIIASHPEDITVEETEMYAFSVSVIADEEVTYRWEKCEKDSGIWVEIPDSNYLSFSRYAMGNINGTKFRCVMTVGEDSIVSDEAVLTVNPLQEMYDGTNTLEVGSVPGYRFIPEKSGWYSFDAGTHSVYSVRDEANVTVINNNNKYALAKGKYYYVYFRFASNVPSFECKVSSEDITISDDGNMAITQQPLDVEADERDNVEFSAKVSRVDNLTYTRKWQCRKTADGEWTDIEDSNSDRITVRNVASYMNGYQYRCIYTFGDTIELVSDAATLTVKPLEQLKLGNNTFSSVEESYYYYYGFKAEKTGMYTFDCSVEDRSVYNVTKVSESGTTVMDNMDGGYYLEKGEYYWVRIYVDADEEGSASQGVEITHRDVTVSKDGTIVITKEPEDVTAYELDNVEFQLSIYRKNYKSYETKWEYQEPGTTEWKDYGSDNNTISFRVKKSLDGAKYRCAVTVNKGTENEETIYTREATLKVQDVNALKDGENTVTILKHYKVTATAPTFVKIECANEDVTVDIKNEDGSYLNTISDGYLIPTGSSIYVKTGTYDDSIKEVKITVTSSTDNVSEKATFLVTENPESVSCTEAENITFKAGANVSSRMNYQWQYLEKDGTEWKNLDGETDNNLTISSNYELNGYQYRCIFRKTQYNDNDEQVVVDTACSKAATLIVTELPSLVKGDNSISVSYGHHKYAFVPEETGVYTIEKTLGKDIYYSVMCDGKSINTITQGNYLMKAGSKYFILFGIDEEEPVANITLSIQKATTQISISDYMFYQYNSEGQSIDVRGWDESGLIQTTFSDGGYFTFIKEVTEENAKDITTETSKRLKFSENGVSDTSKNGAFTVTPNIKFSENGMFAIISYTVKNVTDHENTFSLGVNCDVDIDGDDGAIVKVINSGLSMTSDRGKTYYLICNNVEGITDADAMWFGQFCSRDEFLYSDYQAIESTGYDSELAVSWQNRKLAAGEEVTITFELGIGDYRVIEAPEDTVIASGTCGNALRWTINGAGTLSIRGTGAMYDYQPGTAPWYEYSAQIKNIKVGYGVTSIGSYAFYNLVNLEKASISASVETFGEKSLGYTENGKSENLIIESYEGTKAQEYARENDMQIENLGELGVNHIHTYQETGITEAATCYKEGFKEVICDGCGDKQNVPIPKLAHTYTSQVVAPTCTEQGYTLYTCTNEGCTDEAELHTYKDTFTDAIGHKQGERKNITVFYTGDIVCENCGEIIEKGTDVTVDLSKCTITLNKNSVMYNKNMTLPVATVKSNGLVVPNTDYEVAYVNAGKAGTATVKITGKTERCTGEITKTFSITKQSISKYKFKLAKTAYTYTGKTIKPAVKVSGLSSKTDYSVAYSANKAAGVATVKITGKGNYSGTVVLNFNILPKGTAISKLKAGKGSLTASWKAQKSYTNGYEIRYSLKSNMSGSKTVKITKNKTISTVVKKLKSKKTYYVQVRTFTNVKVNKKTKVLYSDWSKTKSIKVK